MFFTFIVIRYIIKYMKLKKLINCARCSKEHNNLTFIKLKNPVIYYADIEEICKTANLCSNEKIIYTHFCLCPTNNQPILLKII